MAFFKTLKDLQEKADKPAEGGGRFFTVKPGEEYRIRFRQELSEDLNGYDEEAGLAELVMVHTNPGDFTKHGRCTGDMEEYNYKCWACEQISTDSKWKPKGHLLVNIAVQNTDNDTWEPRVLDQKFTGAHVAENLLEYAGEYETILDRDYKIKRKGEKQATQYTLVPMGVKDPDASIKDLPFHDLSKSYKIVAPAEQAAHYLSTEDKSGSSGWD